MKKVLLNTYEGFPAENSGGPNRIIYQLIKYWNNEDIILDFSTYKYLVESIQINSYLNSNSNIKLPFKKRLTNYMFDNYRFYKSYTTSKKYLKKHFEERDKYYDGFVKSYKCDVVHSHSTLAHYHFINTKAKKVLTIHSKGSIQNDMVDELENNSFLKEYSCEFRKREILAYNNSDIVTFPSKYAKELFFNDYAGDLDENIPVEIVYNGVDIDFINSVKIDDDIFKKIGVNQIYDYYFLNIANHVKHKNIDKVLEYVSKIKSVCKINPLLINIGSGPLSEHLIFAVKDLNLINNVIFVPRLSYREVISLMKKCDTLIMLSERVIFDLVILDAIASNMYIISNLEGGNSEILGNYKLFVDYSDSISKLTNKLNWKLDKPILDNVKIFNINSMIKKYEKLYN